MRGSAFWPGEEVEVVFTAGSTIGLKNMAGTALGNPYVFRFRVASESEMYDGYPEVDFTARQDFGPGDDEAYVALLGNVDGDGDLDGVVSFGDFFLFADSFGEEVPGKIRNAARARTAPGTALPVEALLSEEREVVVSVPLRGLGRIAGYGLRLEYDPSVLCRPVLIDSASLYPGEVENSLALTVRSPGSISLAGHLRGHRQAVSVESVVLRVRFRFLGLPRQARVRIAEGWIGRTRGRIAAVEQPGEAQVLPVVHLLYPPYPNPFNPVVSIPLGLAHPGAGKLTVYDALGQIVREWDLGGLSPGFHSVVWDGLDQEGRPVGSGVYLARMRTGEFQQVRKLLLLR